MTRARSNQARLEAERTAKLEPAIQAGMRFPRPRAHPERRARRRPRPDPRAQRRDLGPRPRVRTASGPSHARRAVAIP